MNEDRKFESCEHLQLIAGEYDAEEKEDILEWLIAPNGFNTLQLAAIILVRSHLEASKTLKNSSFEDFVLECPKIFINF